MQSVQVNDGTNVDENIEEQDPLVRRLRNLSCSTLSDAMSSMNFTNYAILDLQRLDNHHHPASHHENNCGGRVFTVEMVLSSSDSKRPDASTVAQYADLCPAQAIVVISAPETTHAAVCGGLIATRLRIRHARGLITNGRIRDLDEIEKGVAGHQPFPVYARGTSVYSRRGQGLSTPGLKCASVNSSLTIAGVTIEPHDYLRADRDGLVIVPRNDVREIISRAETLAAQDRAIDRALGQSQTLSSAIQEVRGSTTTRA